MANQGLMQGGQQFEVLQMKDILSSFNRVTESCFMDCVDDFTSRKVQDKEQTCANRCMEKYLKMSQRIQARFQEYQVMQNENLIAAQQSAAFKR